MNCKMSELSRFFGIIIIMHYKEHNPPHFHIQYNEFTAVFDMEQEAVIEGFIPKKQIRLVLAWFEIHREELFKNWENGMNKKEFIKIEPLK